MGADLGGRAAGKSALGCGTRLCGLAGNVQGRMRLGCAGEGGRRMDGTRDRWRSVIEMLF